MVDDIDYNDSRYPLPYSFCLAMAANIYAKCLLYSTSRAHNINPPNTCNNKCSSIWSYFRLSNPPKCPHVQKYRWTPFDVVFLFLSSFLVVCKHGLLYAFDSLYFKFLDVRLRFLFCFAKQEIEWMVALDILYDFFFLMNIAHVIMWRIMRVRVVGIVVVLAYLMEKEMHIWCVGCTWCSIKEIWIRVSSCKKMNVPIRRARIEYT